MHLFSAHMDIWTYQYNYTSLSISIESYRINSTRIYTNTHTHMQKQIIFAVYVYMVDSGSYSDIHKSLITKGLQNRTLCKSKSARTRMHFLFWEKIFFSFNKLNIWK